MQLIVIIIVLLSFIGVYINKYSVSDLLKPELFKIDNEELIEEIEKIKYREQPKKEINKDEQKKLYDEMGNVIIEDKQIMEAGKLMLSTNIATGSEPYSRPRNWAGNAGPKRDINGFTLNNTSYKNNYPYKNEEFKDLNSSEFLKSKTEQPLNRTKGNSYIGSEVFQGDAAKLTDVKINYSNRAIEILKNRVTFENKDIPDMQKIQSKEILIRNSKKISNVLPSFIETRNVPDMNTVQSNLDKINANDKVSVGSVSQIVNSTIFNLK
jgi:hypothetical protein